MATLNPFDLLGDDDAEEPSQLIAAQQQKVPVAAKKTPAIPAQQQQSKPVAKLPSKPLPPAQAVREAKSEATRGGGRGGGRGYGRGRGGRVFDRDSANSENAFGNREVSGGQGAPEGADTGNFTERRGGYGGPRGPVRGSRRGGYSNGEVNDGERPRRVFERRSGTGRGNEIKRDGAGRGNWGIETDEVAQATEEVNEGGKNPSVEKAPSGEEDTTDGNKETPADESEEKEPENKEMTLEEYEKVLEEKRKVLQAPKTDERKVDVKAFESMQQIANKKANDDVFIKLGSDKEKKKEISEKEEKTKKSLSINEFLKPAEGEKYYGPGGRGRGRGRGIRGYGGGNSYSNVEAPSIQDPGHFPTLSAK